MSKPTFRPYAVGEEAAVSRLMHGLYDEGDGIRSLDDAKIARTFAHLSLGEQCGYCLVAVDEAGVIAAYVLLFPFWSNEYGGLLLLLDEFYVAAERRSQGLGGQFLTFIEGFAKERDYRALNFIAMSHNTRAVDFYLRQGYYQIPAYSFDKLLNEG